MEDLNARLQQAKDIQFAIRVGIHTGLEQSYGGPIFWGFSPKHTVP
jgi:hypothetical protein